MQCSTQFLITLFLAWGTVSTSTTAPPPPTTAGVGIVESLHAPVAPVDTAEKESIDLNSEFNGPTSDTKDVNNPTFFFLNVVGLIVGLVVVAFLFYKAVISVVAFIFYKAVISAAQVEEEKVATTTTTTTTEVQADIEAAIK